MRGGCTAGRSDNHRAGMAGQPFQIAFILQLKNISVQFHWSWNLNSSIGSHIHNVAFVGPKISMRKKCMHASTVSEASLLRLCIRAIFSTSMNNSINTLQNHWSATLQEEKESHLWHLQLPHSSGVTVWVSNFPWSWVMLKKKPFWQANWIGDSNGSSRIPLEIHLWEFMYFRNYLLLELKRHIDYLGTPW